MNTTTSDLIRQTKYSTTSEVSEMKKEIEKINEDIKDLNMSISNNKFNIDTLYDDLNNNIKSNNKKFENLYNKNISINQAIFVIFIIIIILTTVFGYQFIELNRRVESLESTYEISETLPDDIEQ